MVPVLIVTIYTLLTILEAYLTDRCLRSWNVTADKARKIRRYWLIPYLILAALPMFGAFLPDSSVRFALQAAGNIWAGFFMYYGGILLICLLIAFLFRRISKKPAGKNLPGIILSVSLAAGLAVTSLGMIHAQDTVYERYDVNIDKPGEDMKVILISDLHLSVNSKLETTRRMVELINAEEADIAVIAGDIFTSSYGGLAHPEQYAEALRGIQTKYGVYAVYGNHDVEEGLFCGFGISPASKAFRTPEMEQFFDDCGFITLKDEIVSFPTGVQLAGRLDGEKAGDGTDNRMSPEELLKDADLSAPILVLQHEPVEFAELKSAGADLALCGHTHNGQLFPGNYIIRLFNEFSWGYGTVHGLDTIVSAGVGYYGPPMRVGTDSEITVIQLHFSE